MSKLTPADLAWEPELSGLEQMRRDRDYYSAFQPESDRPLLRFYTWSPACLSLGRFENPDLEQMRKLAQLGLESVRRPTGGAAILHAGDLTFSLIGPTEWLSGNLLEGHARLTRALALGLSQLGIQADAGQEAAQKHPGHCFAVTTPADLRVKGQKLIGTAQVRRRKAFLLQGMIYLQADQALLQAVFGTRSPLADLQSLLGHLPETQTLIEAFRAGFSEVFGLEFAARESGDDESSELQCVQMHKLDS